MENIEVMLRGKAIFLEINLYQNTAESNLVNKSAFLTSVGTVDGCFRSETSVQSPEILFKRESIDFNYVFIVQLNRYYYVREVTSVRSGLWRVSFKEDVLMSFKSQIMECPAYVERSESKRNNYIVDDETMLQNDKDVSVLIVPNQRDFFLYNEGTMGNTYTYVLTVFNNA